MGKLANRILNTEMRKIIDFKINLEIVIKKEEMIMIMDTIIEIEEGLIAKENNLTIIYYWLLIMDIQNTQEKVNSN